MVERYVHGRELTCAVMGDVALGVTEIIPTRPFLLRLRFEIRRRRIKTRIPRKNFTEYLPKNTDTLS